MRRELLAHFAGVEDARPLDHLFFHYKLVTAHKRSLGQSNVLQVFVHRGQGGLPTWRVRQTPGTGKVGGTHPTGMFYVKTATA